nr:hypothetical protein [Tanacetum cinerariifolium]
MIKVLPPKTVEEVMARERERKAKTTLLMALLEDHLAKFYKMADANEMWEAIKSRFGSNDKSKKMQKYLLKKQFEGFSMSTSEGLHKGYDKFQTLLSQLEILSAGALHEDAKQKFLRSLPSFWSQVALVMRIKPGLDTLSFDDLYNNLRVFKHDVKGTTASSSNIHNMAFVSTDNTSSTNDVSTAYSVSSLYVSKSQKEASALYTDEVIHSFFVNKSSAPQLDYDDLEHINDDDMEEMDLKWQVAMISMRINKFHKRTGRKLQSDTKDPVGFDKTKVDCFKCHKIGYFARDCRAKGNQDSIRRDVGYTGKKSRDNGIRPAYQDDPKALVMIDGEDVDWSGHVEEDTQNYPMMAYSSNNSGSDNKTLVDELDSKPSESASCKSESSVETPTSMSEPVESAPKDDPHRALKDKGIVNSRCSRHMTWNKAHLADYQEFKCGSVAFECSNGRIIGKEKIKAVKLDFKDVYYVEELKHYNLFSVSQMCDKKNKVLFTDTDCLVLSLDFKLPDKNQVLLKIPKQHNIYSFNLKNIVPFGDLACLFEKASTNESNKWHRRLGHVNFKNLNKLVKGNLVRGLPSMIFENDHTCFACQKRKQHKASCKAKTVSFVNQPLQILRMDLFGPTSVRSINYKTYCLVITDGFSRSDNRTEFKNNDLIEFYGLKGIKKEYSNARTSQQNRVAERKNRTLIDVARYMVLVTKPQNNTPYEIFTGRQPIISYLRPFGCHVTILNTIDQLGKFDGKSNLGFLVRYSLNSKACRVYNLETKRVEENLHVNFLENKHNVAGKGHARMFDLDYLTNYMNYEPVLVENQANESASPKEANNSIGIQANDDQGAISEEIDLHEERFVLPIWSAYSTTVKSLGDKIEKNSDFKSCEKPVSQVKQIFLEELEKLKRQEKEANNGAKSLRKKLLMILRILTLTVLTYLILLVHQLVLLVLQEHSMMVDFHILMILQCLTLRIFMRVQSTFLYGTIDEEVYVTQPPSFVDPKFPNKVYKVVKALYGLHEDPRAWKSWCDEFEELMKNSVKTTSTHIETHKPLVKDEEAAGVDVTPKTSYIQAMKRIFRYLKGQLKLGLWYPKVSSFDLEDYSDSIPVQILIGNPQQEVVNFMAGDLFHGNAKSRLLWLLVLQSHNILLLHTSVDNFYRFRINY